MSAKKFSAAAGILLLICSVVGIFIVIYGTDSPSKSSSSSYSSSSSSSSSSSGGRRIEVEESLTVLHERAKAHHNHHSSRNGSSVKNDLKKLPPSPKSTDDHLRRDSSKPGSKEVKTTSTASVGANIPQTTTGKPRKAHDRNGHGGASSVEKPKILGAKQSSSSSSPSSHSTEKQGAATPTNTNTHTTSSPPQTNWNDSPPSPWSPLMEPNVKLRVPLNQRILAPGESLGLAPSQNPGPVNINNNNNNRRPAPLNSAIPILDPHLSLNKNKMNPMNMNGNSFYQSEEEPYHHQKASNEETSQENQYILVHRRGEDSGEEEPNENEPGYGGGGEDQDEFHVGQLFDLAAHLYASGTNTSDVQEFLRVINETVNRGNNSDLLSRLNELYSRPEDEDASTSKSSSSSASMVAMGRNTFETSLTAFVFMSFGVFLLNQIHNFIGKDKARGFGVGQQARNLGDNSLMDGSEESNLEILFKSPDSPTFNLDSNSNSSSSSWTRRWHEVELEEAIDEKDKKRRRNGTGHAFENNPNPIGSNNNRENEKDNEDSKRKPNRSDTMNKNNLISSGSSSSSSSSYYVNDMFRALLNLVNAYTRNSQVLECIWSLYCQDLDKTANNQGLYGIAARINSIGLRLIMDQIPADLTMDVLLRSLLGWDGLPCSKMFNKCKPESAALTLLAAASGKRLKT